MDKIKEYYNSIIKKANELKQENKIIEAMEILSDELETPYIPNEFNEKIEKLFQEIQFEYFYLNPKKKYEKMSHADYLKEISLDNEGTSAAITNYFHNFDLKIFALDKDFFQDLLKKEDYKNIHKLFIIEHLAKKSYNENLEYYNSFLKSKTYVIPSEIKFIESIPFFKNVQEKILEMCDNEGTIIDLAFLVLYSYYEEIFPFVNIEYDLDLFVKSIFNCINYMLKGEELPKDKITQEIYSVINKINSF